MIEIPASAMTAGDIRDEIANLSRRWDATVEALKESGGSQGSPLEWLDERLNELRAELHRREYWE